jgi:hypothetical protein
MGALEPVRRYPRPEGVHQARGSQTLDKSPNGEAVDGDHRMTPLAGGKGTST